MALTRDQILQHAGSFKTKEVHVPAWADENGDDTVIVRGLTVREFELHQARIERMTSAKDAGDPPPTDASARIIARCVVDENGGRIFRDEDVNSISNLPLGDVMKLSSAILDLSGLGAEAEAEVRGESEAVPASNSSSE